VVSEEHGLRIGHAERAAALRALDEHLEAGRLDIEEYGDRSAAASVATTVDDVAVLFRDLPAPHPPLPGRTGPPAPVAPVLPAPVGHRPPSVTALRLAATLVPVLAVLALVATVAAGGGAGFAFLPLLFFMAIGFGHRRH